MVKIISGGGYNSNKTVSGRGSQKVEPKAMVTSPAAVNQMGVATAFRKVGLVQGRGYEPQKVGPTGAPGKYNSATSGPGSQRTVYRSGTQSTYGPVNPGIPKPAPRDVLSEYGPEKSKG
jgi:hypothetical protein